MELQSVLLTPTNNRLHLHAKDNIRAVRIDRVIIVNASALEGSYTLTLTIWDEDNLQLWSYDEVIDREDKNEVLIDRIFAVWDTMTVAINANDKVGPLQEFRANLFYTLNPE